MEQLLRKMAHQLDSLDEASLMALWDKYAEIVSVFEPTQRWEENALIFAFIQAKRWKNQAFNYHWAKQQHPAEAMDFPFALEKMPKEEPKPAKEATIIPFRPPQKDSHSGDKSEE